MLNEFMKPIIEIQESKRCDSGCLNMATGEFIAGITIREVNVFGLRIFTTKKTTFVVEVWMFSVLIKRFLLKGWEMHYLP